MVTRSTVAETHRCRCTVHDGEFDSVMSRNTTFVQPMRWMNDGRLSALYSNCAVPRHAGPLYAPFFSQNESPWPSMTPPPSMPICAAPVAESSLPDV